MKLMSLLQIVFSVFVLIAVVFSLQEFGIINSDSNAKIIINSKESFSKGENAVFEVKVNHSSEIKKIIYSSPNKTEEKICNSTECVAVFSEIFDKTGILLIEIKAEIENSKEITGKKKIQITEEGKKCSDGTFFGSCSTEKPKYCNNGKLEENCEECGCGKGECIENQCIFEGIIETKGIFLEKKFFKPEEEINLIIETKEISKGEYEFTVEWKENSRTEKTENLTKKIDCTECQKNFVLKITTPEKKGIYSVNLTYKENVYSVEGVNIRNDATAPAKPIGVAARKSDGKILIAWNQNQEDDLMEYRIYRSKEDNQAYTAYVFAESIEKEKTGAELEMLATNYFYLTAVDYYGNESEPSEVIEAG